MRFWASCASTIAAPEAVGFYDAIDRDQFCWDASEWVGDAVDRVQMREILTPRFRV